MLEKESILIGKPAPAFEVVLANADSGLYPAMKRIYPEPHENTYCRQFLDIKKSRINLNNLLSCFKGLDNSGECLWIPIASPSSSGTRIHDRLH
jgi:hypothetical protein